MAVGTNDRIGVIGGGLGGLAAACTLSARGHDVVLFEANDELGGKAAVLEAEGYRFDTGPTILTLPEVLRKIFAEAGRKLEDEIELVRLDPQWRCFFDDGSVLDLRADPHAMSRSIEAFSDFPEDKGGYLRFIELSTRLRDISNRYFFWRSIGRLRDAFDMRGTFRLSVLRDVLDMRPGRTVYGTIRSFVRDPKVAQLLDHFTQYVGSAPDQSPAVLCGIASMQTREGVWYPMGGTRAVPAALERLANELGVEVRTGAGVTRIIARGGAVQGIETDEGEVVPLASVVSNADTVRTYRELLGGEPAASFEGRRKYEAACSGVVLYLGLDRAYEHLLHHNFVFSADPEREFHEIYRRGEPAGDPSCYLCAPSRTEPGVAPPGGDALYVLTHTPYLRPHHDWSRLLPEYRRVVLEKLERSAGLEDIEDRIVWESAMTPRDILDRYRVLDGAIYGLASHGRFLGAFKPANRSPDVRGLYLCGGAAHPGPGMPMVLMSGWIAADCLDQDTGAGTQRAGERAGATPR